MSQNPPVTGPSFEIKHRIVGALILIMLGVVVVPMILSGPKPAADPPLTDAAAKNPDTKVFISKITPITGATPVLKRESKRPPEVANTAPKSAATRTPTMKTAEAKPATKATKQKPELAVAKTDRQDTTPGNKTTTTAGTATKADKKSIERGWIVRIGTFSKSENATRIMSSLKALGFEPSSERVTTSRGVLTRVWVGPYAHRVEAGRARTRIRQATGEKGLIAAFPQ